MSAMKKFSILSRVEKELSGWGFDYGRIPVRVVDTAFRIRYSTPDLPFFWKTNFRRGVYRPLFRLEGRPPVLCGTGPLELIACFPFQSEGADYFLVVGPVLLKCPDSAEAARAFCFFLAAEWEEVVRLVPVVETDWFEEFVKRLHAVFLKEGAAVQETDFSGQRAVLSEPEGISRTLASLVFERRENSANPPAYKREFQFLDAVKAGDPEQVKALLGVPLSQNNFRGSEDPLRRAVYQFVSFVTMAAYFASEGGLDKAVSFALCEAYIQRADQCKTPSAAEALLKTAAMDFAARVRDTRDRNTSGNGHILRCMEYISHHLHNPITLEDLAKETDLNAAYLSVLFKKEIGMTAVEFIQAQRIEEAKNLLRFSERRIAEISSHLAFSSQSYFTSVFRRHTGMTPKQYRELYSRKNL